MWLELLYRCAPSRVFLCEVVREERAVLRLRVWLVIPVVVIVWRGLALARASPSQLGVLGETWAGTPRDVAGGHGGGQVVP